MHITKIEPDQYAVWDEYELMGVYDSELEARDAMIGWNRSLWSWQSLYDIEHGREPKQKRKWVE